jgi:transposase InsO family protein
LNSSLEEFCWEHLIKQHTSNAYTPQQNGLVEWFNCTILEDSGLDKRYWNEIAKVSSLTLNQIQAPRSKKSPFELFKDRTLPLKYF